MCSVSPWLLAITASVVLLSLTQAETPPPPTLTGQHFRVTVVADGLSFVTATVQDGSVNFEGYLVEMLAEIAARAGFTYELVSPSGLGAQCNPQIGASGTDTEFRPYDSRYRTQYNCGSDDVTDLQNTTYASDMYLGLFFMTPERQLKNYFTAPFTPPYRGTLALGGTATGIESFEDLIRQQKEGKQPAACVPGSTSLIQYINTSYPELRTTPFFDPLPEGVYPAVVDGRCELFIATAPLVANLVQGLSKQGLCLANGKPIGLIATMKFGYTHYAIGVGKHLDVNVVNILSYWMNVLTIDGTLAALYQGGTGDECDYEAFPHETSTATHLSSGAIVGIVVGTVIAVAIPSYIWYVAKLKRQEKRYKRRFVQQIARNISIGPRPGSIPPGKLFEQILHIGKGKGTINKEDLSNWMLDIKMDFISDRDFEKLWNAIDLHGTGEVDAVEFIVFMSACGPEFERVYREQENMPKSERLKLAARRLSTIARVGERGVHQLQQKLERATSGRFLNDSSRPSLRTTSLTIEAPTSSGGQAQGIKSNSMELCI